MGPLLFDQSSRAKILVTGGDRLGFLSNMLTNDIQSLKPGEGCYAAFLSPTGRVLADMHVFVLDDTILLHAEVGLADKIISLLEKFIITEDIKLNDVTESYGLFTLFGPRAENWAKACSKLPVTIFPEIYLGEKILWILAPRENAGGILSEILKAGKPLNGAQIDSRAMEIWRIEHGILHYGIDIDENMLLPETGLEKIAANETKGCYPGQEVVARIKTYGGLHRKITGLIFPKGPIPSKGDKIFGEEKEIGYVTSACLSPTLDKGIAIGMIAKGFFEKPTTVKIKAGGSILDAVTTPLPFVKREARS